MKKKLLSIVALSLALVMCVSLTACNKGGKVTTDDTLPTVATPTPSDPVATDSLKMGTSGGDNTAKADVNWMDVRGSNDDDNLRLPKYAVSSDTVTFLCHYELPQPDPDLNNAFRDIYKMKYTTVVAAPEELLNKFVSMVMANEAPDIFIQGTTPTLIQKGYLQPWNDYINFDIGLWKDLKPSLDNLKFNGNYYTIAVQQARWDYVWYNVGLFEENGVKNPKEYYEEGNWNWDTFRECAKAMTIDADSNGTPEIWGSAIDISNCFVYTTGKEFVTLNPDGSVTNNIKSPEIARAVQFYTDLVARDKVVYTGGDGRDQFAMEKIAMIVGGAWYRGPFVELTKQGRLFFVPYPKDPQADKYYIYEDFGSENLPHGAKNPGGAAALETAGRYDMLDKVNAKRLTDEKMMELQQSTNEQNDWLFNEFYSDKMTPVFSTFNIFKIGEFFGDIYSRPLQGEPWATIAEEIAPKIDANIAKVIEG